MSWRSAIWHVARLSYVLEFLLVPGTIFDFHFLTSGPITSFSEGNIAHASFAFHATIERIRGNESARSTVVEEKLVQAERSSLEQVAGQTGLRCKPHHHLKMKVKVKKSESYEK